MARVFDRHHGQVSAARIMDNQMSSMAVLGEGSDGDLNQVPTAQLSLSPRKGEPGGVI